MAENPAAKAARKLAEELSGKTGVQKETPMRPAACPSCELVLVGAMSVAEEASPKPDDVTVCIMCGQICVYTEEMVLRLPTQAEWPSIKRAILKAIK
jgi:hypothetical protein